MDPDLLPSLVSYYQQAQCSKEIGFKLDLKRQLRITNKLQARLGQSEKEKSELNMRFEELKVEMSKVKATADVRQREIESLRARSQDSDKVDRAITETLKVQADSYKREISELREDLKLRNEEILDLRQDAQERDDDLKQARDGTRTRDKEMKEIRDQIRARESDLRKANHWIEKLQANVQTLELECNESRDALDAAREAQAEAEDRYDTLQAQKQLAPQQKPVNSTKALKLIVKSVKMKERSLSPIADPILPDESIASEMPTPIVSRQVKAQKMREPETDYTDPPSKPAKRVIPKAATTTTIPAADKQTKSVKTVPKTARSTSNKENQETANKGTKKRKAVDDFSASPPRSSPPPPESPKRKPKKKPDFSMTPAVEKTNGKSALSLIPLSPPSSKPTFVPSASATSLAKDDEVKPLRKKKKLLGGARTLMDDTPKKVSVKAAKTNLGRELSPLKRPVSSGLIIRN
jgi:predicted  nucleic acid-binding Zn-ribbon protein